MYMLIIMRKGLERRDFFVVVVCFGIYFKGVNELGFLFNNFVK